MNYVESFDLLGLEAKQIPCIKLNGAPTTSTEGAVGLLGMDISSEPYDLYKCVDVNENGYIWKLVGGSGLGDMLKSTYDADNDGIVDNAKLFDGMSREELWLFIMNGTLQTHEYDTYEAFVDASSTLSAGLGEHGKTGEIVVINEDDFPNLIIVDDSIESPEISQLPDRMPKEEALNMIYSKGYLITKGHLLFEPIGKYNLLANKENSSVEIIDNLESDNSYAALSANQGRVLNDKLKGTEINVIGLNEVVPDNAITSLCDFTFTPKTQNVGHGINRITPTGGFKELINFEFPIFTSKGSLCVKDKEGNLKYKKDIDSLINHKNVADTLSKDGIFKKWSGKFYFNAGALKFTEDKEQLTLNNGANFLHTFEFSEDEFINAGIPKQSDNITFISPCLFMGNTGERVYNGVPDPAKFYYENGKYYLEIRTSLNANIIKSYFSYTKVFICYELQTPYMISNYFAMGLSSGDVITFEEDNSYYTDLIERVQLLYDSDLKKWITPSSGDPTPINTTPTMLVNVPTSFSQAIEGFDQAAKMLNNSKSGGSSVEKNSQWIGEGDGKTDYTKQIQGKIDELNILKGGEVYLGKGTYKISSSLILYNNISLIGEGDQTVIEMTTDNTHAVIVSGSHITVRDLTIKITGNCSKYTSCIYINSNNKNQSMRPEMPDNIYCQYNTFTNLNLKGTYGFDWEGNYVKISDKYENYFGCGIMCESLFFNYANIDNVKITGMCHGMHGVGGSNKISIYCENSKIMVYDDAGGGYCDITIFGHTYYGNGTDENHSIVSMSDVVGYFKTLEQSVIREYVYDAQWMKHIFIFEGMTMNNRYLVSQIAGVSYFANNGILDETKRRTTSFVKDLGRGNRNIEEFKKVPYHIGNYYDGYTKGLTSYKENDPIIHNVLSGVGKWGNITSNTTFTGLPLNNICRYPKDGYTNLASAISTVAPSKTNPIEIEIDVSNRPFTCQPNFFIQFDGRYIASDFSVSFDTTNNGEYDKTYTIQDNNDIVYSFYNHQYILFTIYRIKFSFTKAFSFSNFKYQTSNYEKFETPYNENNLIGIVNIGMISNEYVGRAFLGECGGTLYGELNMNSNSLKNIADPVEDNDAANKKYVDDKFIEEIDIVDDLYSEDTIKALSANQGRILNEKINDLNMYNIVNIRHANIFDKSQQVAPDVDDEGNTIEGTGTIIPHCFLDGRGSFSYIESSSSIYNRYFVSNKIFIEPNKHYISVWGDSKPATQIFDKTKQQAWIYDSQGKALNFIDLYHNSEFDTPADASYILITVIKSPSVSFSDSIDIIFGQAMIIEGNTLPEEYMPYGPGGTYLNENIIIPQLENITSSNANYKVRIEKEGSSINILQWYGKKVMCIKMKQKGVNNLFDFYQWYVSNKEQDELIPYSDLEFTQIAGSGTDMFGPHVIVAKNNSDGDFNTESDLPKSLFTGGVHGYNNGTTSPTARCYHISVYADGKMLPENYTGYCNEIKIRWVNLLQGVNTQKADGSGREILKEEYNVIFNGEQFDVNFEMTALEDITHRRFYGLQSIEGCWNKGVYYIGSKINFGFNDSKVASNSGDNENYATDNVTADRSCTQIKRVGDDHIIEFGIDKNVGLGDGYYVGKRYGLCMTAANTHKSYCQLITSSTTALAGGVEMPANSKLHFKGYYKFYPNIDNL